MSEAPRRPALNAPRLFRLLARLTDSPPDARAPALTLSRTLSDWLGWTDAIALSAAITSAPPDLPPRSPLRQGAEAQACAHIKATLTAAITEDGTPRAASHRRPGRPAVDPALLDTGADYAVHRHRYITLQQTMERDITSLRTRLRAALAARAPATTTRLAMADAVMERVLGQREQAVLATVPALLESHFTRLKDAEGAALAALAAAGTDDQAPAPRPGAWLTTFRKDMQDVLLAELDLRFQPVEALLAALQRPAPTPRPT